MTYRPSPLRALILALLLSTTAGAQATGGSKPAPAIADNSFLIEEAYNQEFGVIQHISTFQKARDGSWAYTFTQEWPAPGQRHQLSYTIPVLRPGPGNTGIGDIAVNYRLQALGKDDEPLWFSPRLSVYAPSGDVKRGRGMGGVGIEGALPLSYRVSERLVTHWNALANFTNSSDGAGTSKMTKGGKVGASAIVLLSPTFNLMLESTLGRSEFIGSTKRVESENSFVISPGVRGAFNFASGLQIVPGIAVPIGLGPSDGQRDLFLYLSFEHAVRSQP